MLTQLIVGLALCPVLGSCALPSQGSLSNGCTAADNITHVTGGKLCLVIKTFGSSQDAPVLYVVLHGDTSAGGPSDSHYALAEKLQAAGPPGTVAVAMIRPGYFDRAGNTSSGSNNGRRDNITRENVAAVADAIQTLRTSHGAQQVILVAHSGGAATAAVILGRFPGVADDAVLVSCPCDLSAWRLLHGGPWGRSQSPSAFADQVLSSSRVVAISGLADTNTPPSLAENYVADLKRRGVDARFEPVTGADHNAAFRSDAVIRAALSLAGGEQRSNQPL